MAQLVKALAAKSEFDPWDTHRAWKESATESCTLTFTFVLRHMHGSSLPPPLNKSVNHEISECNKRGLISSNCAYVHVLEYVHVLIDHLST